MAAASSALHVWPYEWFASIRLKSGNTKPLVAKWPCCFKCIFISLPLSMYIYCSYMLQSWSYIISVYSAQFSCRPCIQLSFAIMQKYAIYQKIISGVYKLWNGRSRNFSLCYDFLWSSISARVVLLCEKAVPNNPKINFLLKIWSYPAECSIKKKP